MLGLVRSTAARVRGLFAVMSSVVTAKRRERTEARPRRTSRARPLGRMATGLVAGLALALAAPSAALAMSAGCSAVNSMSGTYTVDAGGAGTDYWTEGAPIANGEVITYSWSGNTKGAYLYVLFTRSNGTVYAPESLSDATAASGSGSFTISGTTSPDDFIEVGLQGYSIETNVWKPSSYGSTVTLNVSCAATPTITSVAPSNGAAAGGNAVVITGTNFSGVTAVSFGGVAATGFAVNSSTQITATVPAHAAGTVDLRVTTADGTSATSAADQYTYIAAPTVTAVSPTAGPTGGGTTVTITGTGFAAAPGTGAVKFGATNATYTINSNTQITATSPANSAGTYDITVTTPGGTSATSAADQFTYIPAPTVTAVSPTAGPTGGGRTVTITGTGFAAAPGTGAVKFGATVATYTINSNTQITATSPANSAGTYDITVTTPGGTSATSAADQFTYITAPTVTSVSPTAGSTGGGTTVTITGTGFAAAPGTGAVKFGATVATYTINSNTQITATSPANSAGTYDVTVTTPGGTSATNAADQFTYITAPTVTSISPTAGPTAGGTTVTITGTGFAAAPGTGAVKFGATVATYTINSNTQITATSPTKSAGTYDITVTTPGGTSATSAADQYTYVGAPTVTSISPTAGPSAGGTTVTITGTGFSGATAVTFGGTAATGFSLNSGTQITATAPAGTGTVDVRVTTAGGTSATSAADQFTYVATPTVTGVSPAAGPTSGGNVVVITGANLTGVTAVSFGATSASFTPISATQVNAVAPAGAAGTVDVRVTTTGGTSAVGAVDQFTYLDAPSVIGIMAPRGPSAGGTVVILQGDYLSATTLVSWGGASIPFSVISDNQIQVTTPAGTVGTAASVTVTSPGGTSDPVQFAYVDTPTVAGLTPAEGPASGGTNVVIHGTNLSAASDVTLAGGSVPFTVISDNALQITTPAGSAGGADIVVSVPYVGTSVPDASARFTYLAAPSVTSVTPNTGSTLGGATVTIGGSAFTGATSVSFGATPATSFTVLSATSISAVVPPGNAGMSDVRVTTAGGTSAVTLWDRYTYFEPPTVTSISPTTGPGAGGATVVISGWNFYTASAVTFGGTAAASFTIDSNDQITATAPAGVGTVDVRVTNLGGTSATSAADQYTYVVAPVVSSLSPATGPAAGGTTVVISGANLSGATAVTFGATAASGYTINSATQITATAPAGTGVVDVRVTTVGGTSATSGADQFTYVAAPTASGLSANVGYETPTAVDLSGSISGVHSSISVATAPAHGTTSISGDVVTYTPAAGYYGTDSFTYTASGLGGTSAPATVSLTVATPAAPTAADKPGVAVAYDSTGVAIDLSGSIGGVHSSIAVSTAPAHGTTSVAGYVVTYTPTAGYYGADSFTYTASGPGGTSAPATVSLTVATPAAPTAADKPGVAVGYESTGVAIDLSGSISGVHGGVAVGTAPAHGTVAISGDVVTYTPAAAYYGTDSFTYTATGPGGTSAAATVSLTVATPAAPTVAASSANVGFEAAQAIDLSASITGVHSSIAVASAPAHGTASVSGDVVTYTPAAGFFGADSFTYTATGPGGTSAPATVSLTVVTPPPPNPAPPAGPAQVVAGDDVGVTITNTGGLATGVQITTPPAHGTVTVDTLSAPASLARAAAAPGFVLTYVPNPGYSGPDSFAYALVGPGGTSQPQQVQVTVLPSVTLQPIEVSTLQGVPVQVDVTAGAAGGPYTGAAVVSVGPSASGTASFAQVGASRVMTFTPADDFTGVAVVTYTVSNANSTSAPSTVTVTVEARPNPALDADVRGLIGAQVQAAQRFVDTQVQNFSQRNEALHGEGDADPNAPRKHALGLTFGFGDYAGGRPEDPAMDLRRREMPERPFADQARKLDELALAAADADASPGGLGPIGGGKVALWSAGSIDFGQRHADAGGSKLKFTTSGVSLGADIEVADGLFVGVGAGYGYDATDIGSEGTRNASRSYMGAVYGSWRIAPQLYLDGVAGLGELSFDSRRIAANDATVIGRRDGSQAFGSLSLAFDHHEGPMTVSSYGRVTVSKAKLDAFTETGDPIFALAYDAQDVDASFGTLGVRGQWNHAMEDGSFTPRVRAEWRRQLSGADAALVRYADFLTGPSYQVDPLAQSQNTLLLGVGGDWRWDEGVALSLDYEGQVGDETLSHRVTLKVSTRF